MSTFCWSSCTNVSRGKIRKAIEITKSGRAATTFSNMLTFLTAFMVVKPVWTKKRCEIKPQTIKKKRRRWRTCQIGLRGDTKEGSHPKNVERDSTKRALGINKRYRRRNLTIFQKISKSEALNDPDRSLTSILTPQFGKTGDVRRERK